MRNEYVADVGDFGKYGLLREVARIDPSRKIGVVWYLTDSAESGNDGRHDGYLRYDAKASSVYRNCDPQLYDRLGAIRSADLRSVRAVEESQILPVGTVFVRGVVPLCNGRMSRSAAWSLRSAWFVEVVHGVRDCEVVFCDPDNGLVLGDGNSSDGQPSGRPSHKHAYWAEITTILGEGKSVIAYHHLGRQRGGHDRQIAGMLDELGARGFSSVGIHFRRGSARVFVVIPATNGHRQWLVNACEEYASKWSSHSRLVRAAQFNEFSVVTQVRP